MNLSHSTPFSTEGYPEEGATEDGGPHRFIWAQADEVAPLFQMMPITPGRKRSGGSRIKPQILYLTG